MQVQFVGKRLLVGYRKCDWSDVWYEPVDEEDDDGAAVIGLYSHPKKNALRREPLEAETTWFPHFSPQFSEVTSHNAQKKEREKIQREYLKDAWNYCQELDPDKVREMEFTMRQPNRPKWNSWFKAAKKWKKGKIREQERKLAKARLRANPARAGNSADLDKLLEPSDSDDESGYGSSDNMPPPPPPRPERPPGGPSGGQPGRRMSNSGTNGGAPAAKRSRPNAQRDRGGAARAHGGATLTSRTFGNLGNEEPTMSGTLAGSRPSSRTGSSVHSIDNDADSDDNDSSSSDSSIMDTRPPAGSSRAAARNGSVEISLGDVLSFPGSVASSRRGSGGGSLGAAATTGGANTDAFVSDEQATLYNGGMDEDEAHERAIRASQPPEQRE